MADYSEGGGGEWKKEWRIKGPEREREEKMKTRYNWHSHGFDYEEHSICSLLSASLIVGFHSENGDSMVLRIVSYLLSDCMVPYPRRQKLTTGGSRKNKQR
jgi:hypothetical protein